ncbi:hypothetical protein V8F06_000878 [Rhypophila decipiens]
MGRRLGERKRIFHFGCAFFLAHLLRSLFSFVFFISSQSVSLLQFIYQLCQPHIAPTCLLQCSAAIDISSKYRYPT